MMAFQNPISKPRLIAILLWLICCLALQSPVHAQQKVDANFYREFIRPILSDKCYTCHGPDEQTREGGFRFDQKESAFAEADSGEMPIVAESVADSELLKRIHATDYSRMPPEDQEKQLTDAEKDLLRRWIEGGAPWQDHWAFESPQIVTPPDTKAIMQDWNLADDWATNPIDAFVLKMLKEKSLNPSSAADKATLIRRVTFDLIGLPPSTNEVNAFLHDDSNDAYEKVVDRLLASPHYGEHFASDWLDVARFADTNGYQNDFSRKMWPWRDWVIEAFNSNMPFDQFTIEQLAGDMLPNASLQQKVASGFNRNNRSVTEGGSIEEEWHVENVIDRVETTATAFLGLTVGCARCHDHKYDPVSQREFYEFYAYFNSSKDKGVYNEKRGNVGPVVSVPNPKDQSTIEEMEREIAELKKALSDFDSENHEKQTAWEAEFTKTSISEPLGFVSGFLAHAKSDGSQPAPDSQDSSDEVTSKLIAAPFVTSKKESYALRLNGEKDAHVEFDSNFEFDGTKKFSVSVWVKPTQFGAVLSRMDAADDYRGFDILLTSEGNVNVHLIHNWPDNAIKVTTDETISLKQWAQITVTYDGSRKAAGVTVYIDQEIAPFTANNDNLNGSTLTDHPCWIGHRAFTTPFAGQVTDLRIFDRLLTNTEVSNLFEKPVQRLASIARNDRSKQQSQLLDVKFQTRFSPEQAKVHDALSEVEKRLNKYRSKIQTTMVMEELETPRKTYLLNRGQYDQPDKSKELSPGVPEFLPQPNPELPSNRLGLAKWIVDPANPLTARVAVNRFWKNYFGTGLLETPENFGVQSPLPSHPKLLDWLAMNFVRSGWDVKSLQKQIVMSETYRQSSAVTKESLAADPVNRWLARGPRFRLNSEAIRDNALAVSGLLTKTIGGPSMKPYQPEGLWKELAGGSGEKPYSTATGNELYRRSLYIYRKRTVPHPTMSTFDAGSREVCQVARQRTNTPLQALALLNDVTYVEAARALATKTLMETEGDAANIQFVFLQVLARKPNEREMVILTKAYERYRERFASNDVDAKELIEFGNSPTDGSIDPIDLAAFTIVCSTILNLDEAITKE